MPPRYSSPRGSSKRSKKDPRCKFISLERTNLSEYSLAALLEWDSTCQMSSKDRARLTKHIRVNIQGLQKKDTVLPPVKMETLKGLPDDTISDAVNKVYWNAEHFNPDIRYEEVKLAHWKEDFIRNSQGIYCYDDFDQSRLPEGQKVFLPSIDGLHPREASEKTRMDLAHKFSKRARDNETWVRSEYAWEADAWSCVFGEMRDDPVLAIDKRDCWLEEAEVDPHTLTLTGGSTWNRRIPDAIIGLKTSERNGLGDENYTYELRQDLLEKLLVFPKCGIRSDLKFGEAELAFPFAVYEAKGWAGDCRDARRQACAVAAKLLDALDGVSRVPGPVEADKMYQNDRSNHYQVFAITSFGAQWHILVGHRRKRSPKEHAGHKGMSDTVYIFQQIWSGRVTDAKVAWQLLVIIDLIRSWAATQFKDFITSHLGFWHKFCQRNFHLDWEEPYDIGRSRKRRRTPDPNGNAEMPAWVNDPEFCSKRVKARLQVRANEALAEAHRDYEDGEKRERIMRSVSPLPRPCSSDSDSDSDSSDSFKGSTCAVQ